MRGDKKYLITPKKEIRILVEAGSRKEALEKAADECEAMGVPLSERDLKSRLLKK